MPVIAPRHMVCRLPGRYGSQGSRSIVGSPSAANAASIARRVPAERRDLCGIGALHHAGAGKGARIAEQEGQFDAVAGS